MLSQFSTPCPSSLLHGESSSIALMALPSVGEMIWQSSSHQQFMSNNSSSPALYPLWVCAFEECERKVVLVSQGYWSELGLLPSLLEQTFMSSPHLSRERG